MTGRKWIVILGLFLIAGALSFAVVHWFLPRSAKPVARPQLTVAGVGLYLGRDKTTRKFVIKRVFPNSPAEKAGLVPGLVVNKVSNVLAETKSIKELSGLLTGPVGTKVEVEIMDTNSSSVTEVELIREKFLNVSVQ
jgi:C-terminal processing protease CtpA/Prc